jgi:hypothetical protein
LYDFANTLGPVGVAEEYEICWIFILWHHCFMKEEIYSITAQIRWAVISVFSRIAKGETWDSNKG